MGDKAVASASVHAVSGTAGGMLAMALLYPLEAIRVHMQVRRFSTVDDQSHHAVKVPSHTRSAVAFALRMVKREGFTALYRGLDAALLSVGVSQGVYFFWYSLFKRILSPKNEPVGALKNVVIAAVAGALNVLVTNPLWTVTTQLTLQKNESFMQCCSRLFNENGIAAFYAGVESSLMLVSNPIIQFVCYEQLRALAMRLLGQSRNLGSIFVFAIGAIAKAIATILTYPLLVAKSKLQAPNPDKEVDEFGNDTLSVIRHIIKVEGISGLYRGIDAKLTQSVLQSAFMFVAYERILRIIIRLLRR
eukprot:TRINITY_DN8778_c0_g1_i2.p1 TRINITY_DN8778_c0_g1~~TRINITY_DN8778_c0_g1_i2.p1  ORF type:complete len:304 (+),score=75.12 TRINITY_DN8778_c0_g1_i2:119-1030(+)